MIRFFVLALTLAIRPALAQSSAILTREAPLIGARGEKIGQVTVRGSANATVRAASESSVTSDGARSRKRVELRCLSARSCHR